MDAIEKRARELLAAAYRATDYPPMVHESKDLMHGRLDRREKAALDAIIAALTPPEGYVLAPVELPDMRDAPGFAEGHYSRSNWHAAIADLQWLAARPEVP